MIELILCNHQTVLIQVPYKLKKKTVVAKAAAVAASGLPSPLLLGIWGFCLFHHQCQKHPK